jgi:hypothetical protein
LVRVRKVRELRTSVPSKHITLAAPDLEITWHRWIIQLSDVFAG